MALLLIVGLGVGGYFYRAYTSEYTGIIVDLDRSLRWERMHDPTRSDRIRYRHYAVIETPEGGQRRVRITYHTHARAEEGDPLQKFRGERYPRLMTEEAISARETSAEAMGMIYDAMTSDPAETTE